MSLKSIEQFLREQKKMPPVHLWSPDLSGDMDMRIAANGDWYHEGGRIERKELVKLFASILRREEDGEYYLVTPVEKWRIQVEDLAFQVLAYEYESGRLAMKTNVDRWYFVGAEHPLSVATEEGQPRPSLVLENGLTARVGRNVFYELVTIAEERDGALWIPLEGMDDCCLGSLAG